jgi:hypothetical protein
VFLLKGMCGVIAPVNKTNGFITLLCDTKLKSDTQVIIDPDRQGYSQTFPI